MSERCRILLRTKADCETSEISAEGTLRRDGEKTIVEFAEADGKTKVRLELGAAIVLDREGGLKYRIVFERGKSGVTKLSTEWGDIEFGYRVHLAEHRRMEEGAEVRLIYDGTQGGETVRYEVGLTAETIRGEISEEK